MNQTRETEAIQAYLKLLQVKGASAGILHKRSLFLDQLAVHLAGKDLDGSDYRLAVETVMESMPADDWHASLTALREFYPFWIKDIKAIAALNVNPGFDVEPLQWLPLPASLKSLIDSLVTEKFEASENWPLKAYSQALRQAGAEQKLVDARVKLAKILLIRLKDAPLKNHKTYRTAVDQTLPFFNIKDNRRLFLVVVREFYHFWTGNPEASSMVLNDGSGNMLF
ncbi:MAG: hypothetical protein U1C48_08695 [Methylotenera sp.]|nr:hypothetical protein [Methylotenera sp.]PKO51671.1 MAG: hypothetical protein CVU27_05645 [Betaproteobacteria bacterium HGW-Betaproteobacteria-20]